LTQSPWRLLASEISVTAVRSVSLGLLAVTGELDLKEALDCSRIEENYQTQYFPRVEGAHDIEEAGLLSHLTCARLLYMNTV
jgi:chaperone required for assembly of F1-ATPase